MKFRGAIKQKRVVFLYDFVIVGSGLAGLSCALRLSSLGKVMVLSKSPLMSCSSAKAQGGIAAAIGKNDSPELHGKDTLAAGRGLCSLQAVQTLVNRAPKAVQKLRKMGVNLDDVPAQEGGHSISRIVHAGSDQTGMKILEVFLEHVLENPKITLLHDTFVFEVLLGAGRCCGVRYETGSGVRKEIYAPVVILASGGIGGIFEFTTNPRTNTGDGISIAYRAGADVADMEFIQFHPTAFAGQGKETFLISETLRGEGALLKDSKGKRFMPRYHPQAELAPRDVVSRAIFAETAGEEQDFVFLDATFLGKKFLQRRFPQIYSLCEAAGYAMEKDYIPVRPAAHFIMGGVFTDLGGRSTVPGLYACGETACTGVHGANRLASNSLLEALVFSELIAEGIANDPPQKNRFKDADATGKREETREIMEITEGTFFRMVNRALNIVRAETDLSSFLDYVKGHEETPRSFVREQWETANMYLVAQLVARAALKRDESRGAHCRIEYPEQKDTWDQQHIFFNRDTGMRVNRWN